MKTDSPPNPPPARRPGRPPDGFPAPEFLRWAKRHDIVRRTFFAWANVMRSVRDETPEDFVRGKWTELHPRAEAVGLLDTAFPLAFCRLCLVDSRGRQTGWFHGLFHPDGEYYDATWNLRENGTARERKTTNEERATEH